MVKTDTPEFMSVREVAGYLGINEKKVYFLAKANKIPCTRVTGKWLFPKPLIDRWIEESASASVGRSRAGTAERSVLLASGSDDPALAILRELYSARSAVSLFMATVGSEAGLESIRAGVADFATAHLLDPERRARGRASQDLVPSNTAVVQLFYRELGWVVPRGNPKGVETVRDLARSKLRFINRQCGSGTRIFLDQQLADARMNKKRIAGYEDIVFTHLDVGVAGFERPLRCRSRHAHDGESAGSRFCSAHARAFRHGRAERSILHGRNSAPSRRRRIARVSRPGRRLRRIRCGRVRTDRRLELTRRRRCAR